MTFNSAASRWSATATRARWMSPREWTSSRRTITAWSSSAKTCARGKFHLQLLRVLLRSDDRGPPVRGDAPIQTTASSPEVDEAACKGCERCVRACPVEALAAVSANDPHAAEAQHGARRRGALPGLRGLRPACRVGRARAPGARPPHRSRPGQRAARGADGARAREAPAPALRRAGALVAPGARAVLGAILRLPPAKRLLATEQVRSRYLEALIDRLPGLPRGW